MVLITHVVSATQSYHGHRYPLYTQQNNLRVKNAFSFCLTLKVLLSKFKIICAVKDLLKLFLDKVSSYSNSKAPKKQMAPTRSNQKIRRNLRTLEILFLPPKCIFFQKNLLNAQIGET